MFLSKLPTMTMTKLKRLYTLPSKISGTSVEWKFYISLSTATPRSTTSEQWPTAQLSSPQPSFSSSGLTPQIPRTVYRHTHTHTHTQSFNGLLSGTTRVDRYQKKHSPTHTDPDHRTSFIIFLHLQRSMTSSLFSLRAWQSSRTTCLQILFGLPLGLGPSTSYSIHFFTQSSSVYRYFWTYPFFTF